MLAIATFFLAAVGITVAQVPPDGSPPVLAMQQPLESGACLDSPRPVPKVLQKPVSRGMQVVRVDEVVSTATMMPGEIVGFVYTTEDGGTWLGQRTPQYVSPAAATAVNAVLASTRVPGVAHSEFPPQSRYGVPTKYPQLFRVQIVPAALAALRVELVPCVIWPSGRSLPDPGL
jgi:hypothetical protein